ncbi:MAG: sugar phosphate nucleotidyltransferase [Candidatus Nanoarchaeia archaeon]|nr:sugar phosphate nucleotidyltransferase [Candidatus Nanoarchaeia archaeon]
MKAVIVAAGLGKRLLPITKIIPKEMLPLNNKPILQHVIEEIKESGINEIIIVINRKKDIIREYFNPELSKDSEELNKLLRDLNINYIYQNEQEGLGHAVLQVKDLIDEPFALLLGDAVFLSKTPCLKQLLDAFGKTGKSIINIERIPKEIIQKRGIAEGFFINDNFLRIVNLIEKPANSDSNMAISARYILTPSIFYYLEQTEKGHSGEIQLTDAISKLSKSEEVYGYLSDAVRLDIGDRDSYLNAIIAFSKDRKV